MWPSQCSKTTNATDSFYSTRWVREMEEGKLLKENKEMAEKQCKYFVSASKGSGNWWSGRRTVSGSNYSQKQNKRSDTNFWQRNHQRCTNQETRNKTITSLIWMWQKANQSFKGIKSKYWLITNHWRIMKAVSTNV